MDDSVGAAQPYWNLLTGSSCVEDNKSTFIMQRGAGGQLNLEEGKTLGNTELTYTIYSVNWRTGLFDASFKSVNYDSLISDTSKKGTLRPLEESIAFNASFSGAMGYGFSLLAATASLMSAYLLF